MKRVYNGAVSTVSDCNFELDATKNGAVSTEGDCNFELDATKNGAVSTEGDCNFELDATKKHVEQGTLCYSGHSYSKLKQIYFK